MRCFILVLLCLAAQFLFTAVSMPPGCNPGAALMAAEKHTHGQGEDGSECKEGSSEHHHHKKDNAHDPDALPEVRSGLDHEHGEECHTCSDYFAEPWRKAKEFSGWMQVKSYKVLLFALLCYLYLKRRLFLDIFKKKAKNRHE